MYQLPTSESVIKKMVEKMWLRYELLATPGLKLSPEEVRELARLRNLLAKFKHVQ